MTDTELINCLDQKNLKLIRLLGEGAEGRVYLVCSKSYSTKCYALKVFNDNESGKIEIENLKMIYQLLPEETFIPKYYDSWECVKIYLLEEYIEGSTVYDLFNQGVRNFRDHRKNY